MSSQTSAPPAPPPPPSGGDGEPRLHIRAIKEMPPSHDHELAVIFSEMRRATGVTREQIAGRLATSVETVEALENGALLALPEWPELKRVVTTYAAQLGLDSTPILRRLEGQLGVNDTAAATPAARTHEPPAPGPPPLPRAAVTAGPPMPPSSKTRRAPETAPPAKAAPPSPPRGTPLPQPPGGRISQQPSGVPPLHDPHEPLKAEPAAVSQTAFPGAGAEVPQTGPPARLKRRFGRALTGLVNWALLVGFVGALALGVWYAVQNPRAVWTAMDSLPDPVPRLMRSAWELVRPLEDVTPQPQISDPDKRKSDKLP